MFEFIVLIDHFQSFNKHHCHFFTIFLSLKKATILIRAYIITFVKLWPKCPERHSIIWLKGECSEKDMVYKVFRVKQVLHDWKS